MEYAIDPQLTYGVLGLGKTGASVFRWLKSQGCEQVLGFDTQFMSPAIEALQSRFPEARFELGDTADKVALEQVDVWIVSPGVDVRRAPMTDWIGNKPIWNDIELFARIIATRKTQPKMIGITGSNGKSTVTKMVEHLLRSVDVDALAVGNVGLPVLDLLSGEALPEVLVIELSSFQLEHLQSLVLDSATLLNLSADHLDRHRTMKAYSQAKSNIFRHAKTAIVNSDDETSVLITPNEQVSASFSLSDEQADFYYDAIWGALMAHDQVLCRVKDLPFEGTHNYANALAALALIEAIDIDINRVVPHLTTYQNLPHRMALVEVCGGIRWINDSKATNVGSTLASIVSYPQHVHLILGGMPKGQDFSPLASEAVLSRCDSIQLIGRAARSLSQLLSKQIKQLNLSEPPLVEIQPDLMSVVQRIGQIGVPGSTALLSPACSSFDMFDNFEDRGHQFIALVHAHCAQFPEQEVA